MKFSIIVPVYMVEEYLDKCVNSVLNQGYQNYELLLIDNASKDNCGVICDNYAHKDPRVRVFHKKENGKPSGARNLGLEKAQGDYIIFLDGDDWMEKNVLQTLHDIISRTGSVDICLATHNIYLEKKEKIKHCIQNYDEAAVNSGSPEAILNFLFKDEFSWAVWRHVFSATLIKNKEIKFDEDLLGSEDADFFMKAILVSNVFVSTTTPLCNYRVASTNSVISQRGKETIRSNFIVAKRWFDWFSSENDAQDYNIIRSRFANMYCSSIAMLSLLDDSDADELKDYRNNGRYILEQTFGMGHKLVSLLYLTLDEKVSLPLIKILYRMHCRLRQIL